MDNSWLEKDPMQVLMGSGLWVVRYKPKQDIFVVSDQGGFIPTHEELGEMIQELCKTYDFLSESEIAEHNKLVRFKHFGDEEDKEPIPNPKPKKAKKPAKGFIYLIRYADSNRHKIGLSANPIKRLDQLQTSIPDTLHLVHTIKVDDMVGSEAFLHLKYQDKRIRGEWFELSNDEVKEFCNYKEGDL